jgi:hypothetical protein
VIERLCSNCEAYKALPVPPGHFPMGECRLDPPQVYPHMTGGDVSIWPKVQPNFWCLGFIPRGRQPFQASLTDGTDKAPGGV